MNRQIDIISADELCNKLESDLSDHKLKITAQLLVEAIDNWPTPNLIEPKDFLLEISNEIGHPLTFKRIENYSKKLHASDSAWKMEATSYLLKMFAYDGTKTLEGIVNDITEYYK